MPAQPALVAFGLDLAQDHHRIPHPLAQQLVYFRFVGIQFAASLAAAPSRGLPSLQRPADRLGVHP